MRAVGLKALGFGIPRGSIYLGSYKVTPKRNYFGGPMGRGSSANSSVNLTKFPSNSHFRAATLSSQVQSLRT